MSFWETITGSDLTREWQAFEARAQALPADYQAAWQQIKGNLFPYGDFTGRNLTPIADAALGLLEEAAADGQGIHEVLGDDIAGFSADGGSAENREGKSAVAKACLAREVV